jgi:putative acetyltransferase
MLVISQVSAPSEIQDVQGLLREYTAWAFTLAADSDGSLTFEGFEQELATLPGIYAPPTGCLLLAREDRQPAGCVALRVRGAAIGELKRLYVRPTFRGREIGRQLVAAVIGQARTSGYRRLILDSHISMTNAHEIYRAAGFRKASAPRDFPEALKPVAVFMELDLEGAGPEPNGPGQAFRTAQVGRPSNAD